MTTSFMHLHMHFITFSTQDTEVINEDQYLQDARYKMQDATEVVM